MAKQKPGQTRASRLLWGSCVLLAVLLMLKFFVADVYRISSESMRPTLFGGSSRDGSSSLNEWVLVRYGRPELKRFELLVVDRGEQDPIVKRVVGLPGESLRIVDGDVFINGERLGREVPRPAPILVFDDQLHAVDDAQGFGFSVAQRPDGPWHEEQGVWQLKGAEIGLGRDTGRSTGMMLYNPDVRDGYLDQDGRRIAGFRSVNDLVLECEVAVDLLQDRLRLQLAEAGDLFEARLRNSEQPGASHVIELVRSRAEQGPGSGLQRRETIEASELVSLPQGEFIDLRFANIDNQVSLHSRRLGLELYFDYESNTRFPGKPLVGDQNVGTRVGLGGEGLEARFRAIRILRDLHYTTYPRSEDEPASTGPEREEELVYLGPDQIYLLGDNSSQSIDSRSYGPLSVADVLGRPVSVVWPLDRVRRLGAQR